MNLSIADPFDLCERLKRAQQEIEVIKREYEAYDDQGLIEVVDNPTEPDPICSSVPEALLFALAALNDAVKNASRLRKR